MNKKVYIVSLFAIALLLMAGCNKDDYQRAISVQLEGSNITGEEIYISMGNLRYDTIGANHYVAFKRVHTFYPGDKPELTVTGKSGKEYLKQPLLEDRIKQLYPFFHNGEKETFNPPAAKAGGIKMGFFVNDDTTEEEDAHFDIILIAKKKKSWEVLEKEEVVLVQDLPMKEWRYVDYTIPAEGLFSAEPELGEEERIEVLFQVNKAGTTKKGISVNKWDNYTELLKPDNAGKTFSYYFTRYKRNEFSTTSSDGVLVTKDGSKEPEQPEI